MKTILVTANDTGVGKTWVSACIAMLLLQKGQSVQVVKPIETGVPSAGPGDVEWIENALRDKGVTSENATFHTLNRFSQPLAPCEAARRDGLALSFDTLVDQLMALPESPWRIIEGAGGISVPLEGGSTPRDWADFARSIHADHVVLVVDDRLGAINQARLLAHYAGARSLVAGWWLNQSSFNTCNEARYTNAVTLAELAFPFWGTQSFGEFTPNWVATEWLPQ